MLTGSTDAKKAGGGLCSRKNFEGEQSDVKSNAAVDLVLYQLK